MDIFSPLKKKPPDVILTGVSPLSSTPENNNFSSSSLSGVNPNVILGMDQRFRTSMRVRDNHLQPVSPFKMNHSQSVRKKSTPPMITTEANESIFPLECDLSDSLTRTDSSSILSNKKLSGSLGGIGRNNASFGGLKDKSLIKEGTLDEIVASIPNNPMVTQILLHTYRTFTNLEDILQALNKRMNFVLTCDNDEADFCEYRINFIKHCKSFLLTWLDPPHMDDFNDPPKFISIQMIVKYLHDWCNLQEQQQQSSSSSAVTFLVGSPSQYDAEDNRRFDVYALWDSVFRKIENVMNKYSVENRNYKELPVDADEEEEEIDNNLPSSPRSSDPLAIEQFTAKTIAEQLTIIDKEIFVKFIPHHCLIRVRNKPWPSNINLHDAHNRLSQVVDHTIYCASLLPDSFTIQVAVTYKWILVVKELRSLKNYNSLYSVSQAITNCKKEYAPVFKRIIKQYKQAAHLLEDIEKLSDPSGNYEYIRQLQEEEGSRKTGVSTKRISNSSSWSNTREDDEAGSSQMYGAVPFLPPFLYELTLVDNASPDTTNDGLVNFRKHYHQFVLLVQIVRFQSSAKYYDSLPNDQLFLQWYNNLVLSSRYNDDLSSSMNRSTSRQQLPKIDTVDSNKSSVRNNAEPESIIMKVKLVDSPFIGESDNSVTYKSIMVSPNDMMPAIIKKCLNKFHLPAVEYPHYHLVQKLSNREVVLPTLQNAYYAIAKDDVENIFCELRRTPIDKSTVQSLRVVNNSRSSAIVSGGGSGGRGGGGVGGGGSGGSIGIGGGLSGESLSTSHPPSRHIRYHSQGVNFLSSNNQK